MIITLSRLQGVPPWYHTTTPHTRPQQSTLIACLLGENSLYECERVYTRLFRPRHLMLLIYISWLCVYHMLLPPSWLSWFLEKAMPSWWILPFTDLFETANKSYFMGMLSPYSLFILYNRYTEAMCLVPKNIVKTGCVCQGLRSWFHFSAKFDKKNFLLIFVSN